MRRLICAAPALLSILVSHVAALPAHAREATVITRRDDILDEYDFIVVGAGTAGLTVADRLSESGDYTVLVIEYGYLDMSHSIEATVRPDIDSGPSDEFPRATRFYNLTAVPQPGLGYSTPPLMAGAVVGGSSAVNGMFFMRGSAEDYDSWVWAAGEEHEEAFAEEWGWDNILPYFKKSVTFTPPTEEMVREYNITYDVEAAYGGTTPIHSSYRPFHWPATVAMWNAFKRIPGFRFPKEGAAGDQTGVIWAPNSRDPATERRSFSRPGHYTQEDGPASRDNFHLLTGHRVTQLILSPAPTPDSDNWSADGMRYTPRDGDMPESAWEVRAKREVIIAAGAAHTPQVLQRSGIGPRQVLEAAGAEVKVELPGVGENFQDHMNFAISYSFSKSFSPNSTTLSRDPEYAAQALDLWETNKTGPYTTFVNSAVFLPLPHFTNRTEEIVGKLLAQDPAEYLHEGVDETVIAGYVEQKKTLARQFRSEGSTLLEVPFSGGSSFSIVLCKSISRGTIHLSPDDDGVDPSGRGNVEPLVDYRAFSNPLDLDLVVELLRGTRQFMSADAMVETFGPVETSPGAHITSDEDLKAWIASRISPSTGHPVGTASLAPRELGGVVGPDLRVYGTRKLSVADNSIMPLVPSTHTSSTAYAIGEKAADLVLRRARRADGCKSRRQQNL